MIVQKNLYLPGQDLTNLAQNVDYNRYQDFKGTITVNFGTVPATVTVKVGTILEVNGNLYAIETADYVFQMDNATHKYLTFTDNPAVDFGSAAAIGTYTAAKQGYYQAGNIIRTLPFYIDQTNKSYFSLIDEKDYGLTTVTRKFDRMKMNSNANTSGVDFIIEFSSVSYDVLGSWDTVNYQFVVNEDGFYSIKLGYTFMSNGGAACDPDITIRNNGNSIAKMSNKFAATVLFARNSTFIATTEFLIKNDVINFFVKVNGATLTTDNVNNYTFACIDRLL